LVRRIVKSETRNPPNAGLKPQELAVLRAALLEQRAFRREQLAGIRRSTGPDEAVGDRRTARAQVRDHLAVAARIVLADVEAALHRIDTGHYGQCRACRGVIELSRLRICPQALYCGECHRVREAAGG